MNRVMEYETERETNMYQRLKLYNMTGELRGAIMF